MIEQRSSYGNFKIPQLHYIIDGIPKKEVFGKEEQFGQQPVLSMFERKIDHSNRLELNCAELQHELDTPAFNDLVDFTVRNLTLLNRRLRPRVHYPEAARRLVINEVIKTVVESQSFEFNVENVRHAHQSPGKAGWGPLDFTILRNLLLCSQHDHDSQNDRTSAAEGDGQPVVNNVEVVSDTILGPTIDFEAKMSFTDNGLAQLGAQLYDLFADHAYGVDEDKKSDSLEVIGVLTTGHRWKYFSLSGPMNATSKPISEKYQWQCCVPQKKSHN